MSQTGLENGENAIMTDDLFLPATHKREIIIEHLTEWLEERYRLTIRYGVFKDLEEEDKLTAILTGLERCKKAIDGLNAKLIAFDAEQKSFLPGANGHKMLPVSDANQVEENDKNGHSA